jgi:mono/diheme cytochrome c family protein
MRPRLVIIALLLFIQLVSFASAQNAPDTSKKKNSIYAEIGKAPDKARARQNPFRNDREAITAGGILYAQHCAECHGSKAEGRKRGPSLLVSDVQSAEPGRNFLDFDKRCRPSWHAGMVQAARTAALAGCQFSESLRNPSSVPVEASPP